MGLRDFALMVGVCLVWALNSVISKLVVSGLQAPPLFYAAVRFAIVVVVTLPWLLPAPRRLWRLVLVGLLMGGGTFALMFIGLKTATPSETAIVSQIGIPITTLLSVIFLGERIRWRRGLGIFLTLAGALTVMWDPRGVTPSVGVLLVAAAAVCGSVGAIMMKQIEGVRPLQFQAWVGFSSVWPMILLTAVLERGQVDLVTRHLLPFAGAVLFSALVVSVIGHTAYYGLIQRHEVNVLQPLTLMMPLMTIGLGVLITHDHFDARMAVGTAIALLGVLIIALRRNQVMPLILLLRNRAQ
jgi:drug/metabolite transporter (DMT)-like permease